MIRIKQSDQVLKMWGEVCSRQKLLDKGNSGKEVRAQCKGTLKTLHKFFFSALNNSFLAYNPPKRDACLQSNTSFISWQNYHIHIYRKIYSWGQLSQGKYLTNYKDLSQSTKRCFYWFCALVSNTLFYKI